MSDECENKVAGGGYEHGNGSEQRAVVCVRRGEEGGDNEGNIEG